MKLQQTIDYLLLIDEEAKINEGDTVYEDFSGVFAPYEKEDIVKNPKKIVAYYPLNSEAKELDLPLLPNPFEEIDVEKLAQEYTMSIFGELDDFIDITEGFKAGYKAAQPKQFSLEDMKRAIEMAREMKDDESIFDVHSIRGFAEICTYDWEERYSEKEIIQSLSTRQLPKGFIPEYQRVRDWDSRDINGDYNSKLQLKTITNSEGKQELVGTYK